MKTKTTTTVSLLRSTGKILPFTLLAVSQASAVKEGQPDLIGISCPSGINYIATKSLPPRRTPFSTMDPESQLQNGQGSDPTTAGITDMALPMDSDCQPREEVPSIDNDPDRQPNQLVRVREDAEEGAFLHVPEDLEKDPEVGYGMLAARSPFFPDLEHLYFNAWPLAALQDCTMALPSGLQSLSIRSSQVIQAPELAQLLVQKDPELKSLYCNCAAGPDCLTTIISACPRLETLRLSGLQPIVLEELHQLKDLLHLKVLALDARQGQPLRFLPPLHGLKVLARLEKLSLRNRLLGPCDLIDLARQCTALKELDLRGAVMENPLKPEEYVKITETDLQKYFHAWCPRKEGTAAVRILISQPAKGHKKALRARL